MKTILNSYLRSRVVSKINKSLVNIGVYRLLFPSEIYVSVNTVCNARCRMCDIGIRNTKTNFYRMHDGKGDMSIETFSRLAAMTGKKGVNISFKMTEPLLHSGISEVMRLCKTNKINASVTTNGLLLSKKAESLVRFGLRGLQISINGPEEIHNKVCGIKGAYNKIAEGIKRVNHFKHKYRTSRPKIMLRMTIFKDNYERIEESLDHFKDAFNGINSVVIAHLDFTEDNMDLIKVKDIDVTKLYSQIKKVKSKKYPFKVKFFPEMTLKEIYEYYNTYNELKNHNKCSSVYKSLAVLSNGDITPHIRCLNVSFGNINKEDISKIWNKKEYIKFRKDVWAGLPVPCRRCCQVM